MKRVYIVLYFLFALFSLNANEFLRGILNSADTDVDFEDFKMQENSLYISGKNKKDKNEKTWLLLTTDKEVFNLMYLFGAFLGAAFSNTDNDKTKAKDDSSLGINGVAFIYLPEMKRPEIYVF
ncbi:hypothetical protein QIA36_06165 (plasmid) [Borreliella yangtzensis]|uniref:hypothetical protein n=1 Tax=Borreliella yangtzensis TaxID=683292 RepID=UPI003B9F742E